ncbi:MAG TPA: fused MFS/spermidine synthase, partial [Pyrinomonadaceae bacterium]|nr:fused MFS/spermidine synthase [Pyrinomonadaceae bacterium]
RRQALLHLALLVAAIVALPFGVAEAASRGVPNEGNPVFWLLKTLLLTIGLPFFVVSASAPLLQRWFSRTRHASAGDPYFLYSASNAGSLLALVGFPLLLEPQLTLQQQSRLWTGVYVALLLLVCACALVLWRGRAAQAEETNADANADTGASSEAQEETRGGELNNARRLRWTVLAFAPSSLVLGVTTYITTDIAAVPLLWVIPLALYLLTFVLVFARRRFLPRGLMTRLVPAAAILVTLVYLSGATEPAWFLILVHLVFFFLAAYVCHLQLAEDRPGVEHLAEFYLWLAVGGVAGGLFNALLAPLVFTTVLEYPLVILLACFLCPPLRREEQRLSIFRRSRFEEEKTPEDETRARRFDLALPLVIGLFTTVLLVIVARFDMSLVERTAIVFGLPLMLLNHFFTKRRLRFVLGLGAVMLAAALFADTTVTTLYEGRNFYGTLRVTDNPEDNFHRLYHGSTLHGRQRTDEARRCEPVSYYHREGPLGSIVEAYNARPASAEVAAVGLGTGASIAHARPGQTWTFYELDPAVLKMAADRRLFTYISDCAPSAPRVVLGDARLRLREATPGSYGLILLDAFSSDAIPPHLLTREALALYLEKLAPGGLIAFHVSNRSLDLQGVVSGLARDAGLVSLVFDDREDDAEKAKEASQWIAVARRSEDLDALREDGRWQPVDEQQHPPEIWRDDFSDIVSVFKW